MKPYRRQSDKPAAVRKFRLRTVPRHARLVRTVVGRRRRYEQMFAEALRRFEAGQA